MSDARLSEEKLDELERVSLTPHRAMQLPTMDVRWLVREIRHHRARQLSAEDADSLRYDIRELASIARDWVQRDRFKVFARIDECKSRAIALLDRLAGEK